MTQTTIRWFQAQINRLSEVEGIMVLDDIVGFLSPSDYMEFAHPCLKKIVAKLGICCLLTTPTPGPWFTLRTR